MDNWDGIVEAMFEQQRQIMVKYKEMEQLPSAPLSLHTPHCQRIIKDFAWRVTEEMTESYEALLKDNGAEEVKHRGFEELADATHFLIEMLIFTGISPAGCLTITPTFRPQMNTSITGAYWHLTYQLGLAMNFLKNKPWKKSRVPTDEASFRVAMVKVWVSLLRCWTVVGCEQGDLFKYYSEKTEIILVRQRNGY
jgi:hypothetical protein